LGKKENILKKPIKKQGALERHGGKGGRKRQKAVYTITYPSLKEVQVQEGGLRKYFSQSRGTYSRKGERNRLSPR